MTHLRPPPEFQVNSASEWMRAFGSPQWVGFWREQLDAAHEITGASHLCVEHPVFGPLMGVVYHHAPLGKEAR